MRVFLMHENRDFDPEQELPPQEPILRQDLELDTLLRAMANDDEFLFDVARKVFLVSMDNDAETIRYRQAIVKDCLQNPAVIRELYDLAVEAIEGKKKSYWSFLGNHPSSTLYGSIKVLQMFMDILRKLKSIADTKAGEFKSKGLTTLFAMLQKEFSDEYLASIQTHLTELKFGAGVLLSAELGAGNEGSHYMLCQPHSKSPNWFNKILGKGPHAYTLRIADRDEVGAKTLATLQDRGVNLVANSLAQSMDHILNFFERLRTELAYYVGCLNLHAQLSQRGAVCFPDPSPVGSHCLHFSGLYDASLALSMQHDIVGNSLDADGKSLIIITGANQGGKSSFLRGVGLAQLMMHCGLFVAAESYAAELCSGLFTHYKREEDASMMSGKLDEECVRLNDIVNNISPGSMLLFNESFASTNEREGAEIARQIVHALLERHIKVVFVTHLYDFARGFFNRGADDTIFLRAERRTNGTRTFRLAEGRPLETSYGEDLYKQIFPTETGELRAASYPVDSRFPDAR